MFETAHDIVAWPVQKRFAHSGMFQKLFTDRGEIISNLGYSTSFPRNQKNNSVEIAYISYKNLRYTFDKSAEKIDGGVLAPMLKLAISSDLLNFFFLKLSMRIFPLNRPSNLVDR